MTNTLSAINIWTPQILKSFNEGSSNIVIGMLAAVPQLLTIVAMILWSRRSDRRQERKLHRLIPYLFAAAGWLLATGALVMSPIPMNGEGREATPLTAGSQPLR